MYIYAYQSLSSIYWGIHLTCVGYSNGHPQQLLSTANVTCKETDKENIFIKYAKMRENEVFYFLCLLLYITISEWNDDALDFYHNKLHLNLRIENI